MADSYHPVRAYSPARAMTEPENDVRTPGRLARGRLMVIGVVSAIFAAAVVVVPSVVANADTPTISLVVNSNAWGGSDTDLTDSKCLTSTGVCTLRAAIEQSNAINGDPGQVSITVDPDKIAIGTVMPSATANTSANNMPITPAHITNAENSGAYFNVTAPVTIDLGHRLQVDGSANGTEYAAFYLNGPDIQLLNADQVLTNGTSFVVGPQAKNVLISGDSDGGCQQVGAPTYCGKIIASSTRSERFVVFREGASNVTISNYQVTYSYTDSNWGGIFVFDSYLPYTAMNNIVIDNVQVIGGNTRLTNFWYNGATDGTSDSSGWNNNTINGLTFTNMLIQNLSSQLAFQFREASNPGNTTYATRSATISDLVIENNAFIDNQGNGTDQYHAFITLPSGTHLTGTNSISNNVFTRASSGNYYAIYYYGPVTSSTSLPPSGLTINNNYFNGYTSGATIRMERAGLVTVMGNTFGISTGSQSAPGTNEEYTDSASVMFNTFHSPNYSTNQSIRTWAPTATAWVVSDEHPAPSSGALEVEDPLNGAMPTCPVTVQVSKITVTDNNSQAPGSPVTLQAYWTKKQTAEVYLGQVTGVTGSDATLLLQLPVGTIPLHDGITDTATIVDSSSGSDGNPTGFIRLQTHVEDGLAQPESSQYSRMVAVSGTCRPVLKIKQADGMEDLTYGRDLHFTLTSSVPLDPNTISTDDFNITVTPVDNVTIYPDQPGLLNPRIISIESKPGSNDMEFDIIVQVDDSANVSIAVDADKVASTAGLTNQSAATSTDNTITFINPLVVSPTSFTLITGEESGKQFTIGTVSSAPVPNADIVFTATVDQPDGTPMVSLSTNNPVIQQNQTSPVSVTVKAAATDNPVEANTETTIKLAVKSSDPNYNGLVMPKVTPYLFSTDPTIQVTKQAYTGMTDMSTVENITNPGNGGVLTPPGTRLMDGQTVCFVYTVTNTSKDNWPTSLKNIVVTDSDTRLGPNQDGVIGTIDILGMDDPPAQLFWCTSLMPVDTTIGN